MKQLKEFVIPFIGVKLGEHTFDFKITKTFFEYFEYEDFNNSDINLEVLLIKKNTMLEFTLSFKGCVNVNCDVTNEPYDQNITGSSSLLRISDFNVPASIPGWVLFVGTARTIVS